MTPIVEVQVASIYNGPLPERMAKATRDTATALARLVNDLATLEKTLRLSDLYRSYDMQKKAYQDYVTGKKSAYSPPPGGSLHEAGRAMDIDLDSIGMPLSRFWEIAGLRGFVPIIDAPISSRSEAWHFECRGSHAIVYRYVSSGRAGQQVSPYKQMARSAILATGQRVDDVADQRVGRLQSSLIRLGFDPGRIDGVMGDRTRGALLAAQLQDDAIAEQRLNERLREGFPDEFDHHTPT